MLIPKRAAFCLKGAQVVEHALEMPPIPDEEPVQTLRPHRADPALRVSFGPGGPQGLRRTETASLRKTSSNAPVNLLSRSRTRNRTGRSASGHSRARFLACWVTQVASGFAVQPPRCTRRLRSSMKKST